MTPYLVLGAVAWATATRGGTTLQDLLVVLLLLGAAAVAGRSRLRPEVWSTAAATALLGWLIIVGPVRAGPSLESLRVPLLVVAAYLCVLVVRCFGSTERQTFLDGIVLLGCLHSAGAVAEVATAVAREVPVLPRADSLLGSPNGLGALLLASSVLTAREVGRRRGRLAWAALVLQGCAVLATGSRTAIVVGSLLLVGYAVTRPGRRWRILAVAAVGPGIAIVIWRFRSEPIEQRPHLWGEALRRIADRPLIGEGPVTAPFDTSTPAARVTTHAHNEILQWGVEYGLVGVVLALLTVALALRATRPLGDVERWALIAGAVLLVAGLTDFTLRITALAVTAAALLALGAPRGSRPRPEPRTISHPRGARSRRRHPSLGTALNLLGGDRRRPAVVEEADETRRWDTGGSRRSGSSRSAARALAATTLSASTARVTRRADTTTRLWGPFGDGSLGWRSARR